MTDPLPQSVALEDCDKEPIHIPGSIQPHGALLAADSDGRVLARSANLESFLGCPHAGESLADYLGPIDLAGVERALTAAAAVPSTVPSLHLAGAEGLDVIVHQNEQGLRVLEFERHSRRIEELADVHRQSREAIGTLSAARSLDELYRSLVSSVRRISGFDRVMLYRFEKDASGLVLAEDLAEGTEGFRGHRFPASDIPKQARRLYELNLLRLIPDVSSEQVPLLASAPQQEALDLSFSVLRSVSPIHVRYLENMGVAASLSISVLSRGQLWGLIACHHPEPRAIPFETRQVCELLGQTAALRIELQQEQEARTAIQELGERTHTIVQRILASHQIEVGLRSESLELATLFDSDAFLLQIEDDAPLLLGEVPGSVDAEAVASMLREHSPDPVWATEAMRGEDPPCEDEPPIWPAGALTLRIGSHPQMLLSWLRPEVVETVTWAGDPDKPVLQSEDGVDRLQPRSSFEAWKVERRGHSAPWSHTSVAAVASLRQQLIETALRLAEERRTAAVHALNEELRVANADLDRFVSIVAHDLQAPVRAIDRLAQWIASDNRELLTGESAEHLELLTSRSQRLGSMLRDLVEFSRADRQEYEWERFDLGELWREPRRGGRAARGLRRRRGAAMRRAARAEGAARDRPAQPHGERCEAPRP